MSFCRKVTPSINFWHLCFANLLNEFVEYLQRGHSNFDIWDVLVRDRIQYGYEFSPGPHRRESRVHGGGRRRFW